MEQGDPREQQRRMALADLASLKHQGDAVPASGMADTAAAASERIRAHGESEVESLPHPTSGRFGAVVIPAIMVFFAILTIIWLILGFS